MTFKKTAGEFIFNVAKKAFGGNKQKTTGTGAVNKVDISKNLKKFQEQKDEIIKTTDKYTQGLKTQEGKTNVRKFVAPALGRISKITQNIKKRNKKSQEMFEASKGRKFNKGGRVGLKFGSKKKSNVQKIKETFGPGSNNPKKSAAKKSTKFGMLSVKAGIDKNPNPTQADRIAGAKMKNKKRFV